MVNFAQKRRELVIALEDLADVRRSDEAMLEDTNTALRKAVRKAAHANVPKTEIAKATGLSRQTVFTYLREDER